MDLAEFLDFQDFPGRAREVAAAQRAERASKRGHDQQRVLTLAGAEMIIGGAPLEDREKRQPTGWWGDEFKRLCRRNLRAESQWLAGDDAAARSIPEESFHRIVSNAFRGPQLAFMPDDLGPTALEMFPRIACKESENV